MALSEHWSTPVVAILWHTRQSRLFVSLEALDSSHHCLHSVFKASLDCFARPSQGGRHLCDRLQDRQVASLPRLLARSAVWLSGALALQCCHRSGWRRDRGAHTCRAPCADTLVSMASVELMDALLLPLLRGCLI